MQRLLIREVPSKLHKHCINLDNEIIRKIPLKILDFTNMDSDTMSICLMYDYTLLTKSGQ